MSPSQEAVAMRWLVLLWLFLPLRAEPTITLVPLDDRPSTLLFVHQLARVAGARTVSPPRFMLRPGQPEPVARWLRAQRADYTLVSADMLCYGGLVGSRSAETPLELASRRLEALQGLKPRGGRVDVLTILPRLSLRTSDRQAPYERQLARWAANPESPAGVPEDVLREYQAVRERNLAVILEMLDLLEQGLIDRLVVGQDDSAATGLHRHEADRLRRAVRTRHLEDRFLLLSGADELAMDMVSGFLADQAGYHPSVRVVLSDPAAADRIPPLESYPLEAMIDAHLRLAGARRSEPAEVVLMVRVPHDTTPLEAFLAQLQRHSRVALADLSRVNRMEPELAEALLREVPLTRLEGLAGWNTAANAFGTALAQLVCHRLAARHREWSPAQALESEKTHQAFLLARLIDDYAYQAVVRPERETSSIAAEIRQHLLPWARTLFEARYRGQVVPLESIGGQARIEAMHLEVVLPWQRVFEVEVRVDLKLRPHRPIQSKGGGSS